MQTNKPILSKEYLVKSFGIRVYCNTIINCINYLYFIYVTGSAAYKMLTEMLLRPRLISAIRKLSQYHQTSGLEAKHAPDNLMASKNTYHSYHSLSARCVRLCMMNNNCKLVC